MPRASKIAQADISRILRALKQTGVTADVRITPAGDILIQPKEEGESTLLDHDYGIRL